VAIVARQTANRDTGFMNQSPNSRRGRGRNSGKRNSNQNSRSRNYDGSNADNKIRGSAQQILDKYQALAHDAALAGDRIAAEGFHQYAEHYFRILNPEKGDDEGRNENQQERNPRHQNKPRHQSESRIKPEVESVKALEPVAELTQVATAAPVVAVAELTSTETAEEGAEEKPPRFAKEAPVVAVAELTPTETAEEGVEEKPPRRGRPRKDAAAEPAA
jgi:hypothetical protein